MKLSETTMRDVRYGTEDFFGTTLVCMDDPIFAHAWYLKSIRNGVYTWTRSALSAKGFSVKTAAKHYTNLVHGADKDWEAYRNMWKQ